MIVKMDDVGLALAQRDDAGSQKLGNGLVAAMPKVLTFLSVIGTAAMLWVGGHILLVSIKELGWEFPYNSLADIAHAPAGVSVIGGFLEWLILTFLSAVVGIIVGTILVTIHEKIKGNTYGGTHAADHAHAH